MVPTIGMDATYTINGDEYPCSVTEILRNGKTLVVTLEGSNAKREFTLRVDGRYLLAGEKFGDLVFGEKNRHIDPSY
jgi:hypothetical protein